MRIQYIGMFDEVLVPEWEDANGYPQRARAGQTVDVPEELAVRLLEQTENWAKPPAAPARKTEGIAAE